MSDTLRVRGSGRKYQPRGVVERAYQQATGAATLNAAHSRAVKLEAEFFQYLAILRLQDRRDVIARLWMRFQDETDTSPLPDLKEALRLIGGPDRNEDETRELLHLDGPTPELLRLFEARLIREISPKLVAWRVVHRELGKV